MFNFLTRSQPRFPTIRQMLVQSGLPIASDPNLVTVLEKRGQYAGRSVNFFRACEAGAEDVPLATGHVEPDGLVVVDSRPGAEGAAPIRQPADRATHADDERLVFWDADAARSSEATLSGPAATWQLARSSTTPRVSP